jgi:predicted MFS family arabinose efflux permease
MYSPARRATAIAVYSTGIYLGTFLAYEVGGWLCKEHGWTVAFAWFGAPGIVLAVLAFVAMREPPRTGFESSERSSEAQLAELWRSRAFRHLALGAGIKSIAGYALLTWVPTFFTRVHGLDSQEVGSWLGPIVGLGGAIGTFGGGWIADLLGHDAPRRRLLSAAWATLAATPFLYAFLFAATPLAAFWLYLPASILGAMYLGPAFAFAQDCAQPGQRALASAVLLFLVNLIGLGLGPYVVGALSDFFAASQGPAALRSALAIVSVSYVWGAAHLAQAARLHGAQTR